MDRVLLGGSLQKTFSLFNTLSPQGRYGTIYRGDPGLFVTFGSEEFRK